MKRNQMIHVVIDGNNLAQHKYNISGKVSPEIDRMLIASLSKWSSAQLQKNKIELFLDYRAMKPDGLENVDVLVAMPDQTADENIIERNDLHFFNKEPCVTITNDDSLKEEVIAGGSRHISVFDFCQRIEKDEEFMRLPKYSFIFEEDNKSVSTLKTTTEHLGTPKPRKRDLSYTKEDLEEIHKRTLELKEYCKQELPVEPKAGKLFIRINLKTWDVKSGIQFILESACRSHRKEIESVTTNSNCFNDLDAAFELLIDLCRDEDDFVTHGGSLMDQLRLHLIKQYPKPIEYEQLEKLLLKGRELRKKINKFNGTWYELFEN